MTLDIQGHLLRRRYDSTLKTISKIPTSQLVLGCLGFSKYIQNTYLLGGIWLFRVSLYLPCI